MMNLNILIITFVRDNYLFLVLGMISIIKIIPPEWSGFNKFKNNVESEGRSERITILNFILHNFLDSLIRCFIPVLSLFGLKNMVSLIIFMVVIFDIFVRTQITTQSVTLVGIGLVALYMENLVATGKKISCFGIFSWERKD